MTRLDRSTIVDAALRMLDEVGLDNLSTRALAQELGVQSPALYWHFSSKRELFDAMAQAILARSPRPEPPRPGDDPSHWLVERGRTFRAALLSHRDGARLHAGTRPSPGELPSLDAQVTALIAAGNTPEDALRAVLAVSRYTVGWVLEEQADAVREGVPGTDHAVALDDYPALRAGRSVLEQRDPDADFDFGLKALVDGLAGRVRDTGGTG